MSEPDTVKLDDLEEALWFVGAGELSGASAWVCRATGEVLWHSDAVDDLGPLPPDIDDAARYVAVPDRHTLGLGKPLALAFARTQLPACYEQVRAIFAHRGAYARFKDLLERHHCLDAWHRWEAEQAREALRAWCADSGLTPVD